VALSSLDPIAMHNKFQKKQKLKAYKEDHHGKKVFLLMVAM
jgi:hypothetical protein